MRHTAGYSLLDRRINEDISEKFKVNPVKKELAKYKET